MYPGFRTQPPISIFAADVKGRALDTRHLARGCLDDLRLEAVRLGPAQVHAQDHVGPILRLGPARTGLNIEIRIAAVHLSRKHAPEFQCCNTLLKGGHVRFDLRNRSLVIFFDRKREQLGRIVQRARHFVQPDHNLFQARTLLAQRLRALGFVPDVGLLEFAPDLSQSFRLAVVVKDTSSAHWCAR